MQNQAANLRNIEVQIAQLTNLLPNRPQESLASTTEVTPIKQVQARSEQFSCEEAKGKC